MKQVVILAGGKGTRLVKKLGNLPKALAEIDGQPLIFRHFELAALHDFRDVLLLVCQGADAIRDQCGDGSRWGLRISYAEEIEPRGTAGAVLGVLDQLSEHFLVTYGDTVLNVDLDRMWRRHLMASAAATLLVHPNDHPHDSDIVELDSDDWVRAIHPYPHDEGKDVPNLVNGALYVIERAALTSQTIDRQVYDFGKHLFPKMVAEGAHLHGYRTREYIKDAGTPERLARVIEDVRSGKVARGVLTCSAPAVILDRDGTINVDAGHIARPEGFSLLAGAAEAVRRLNRSEYLTAVVTNQPVIARGEATEEGVRRIHNRMETLLGRAGAYVDAIYYCPHHPDAGFPGERPDLKIHCDCRKPGTAMIDRAIGELGLSRRESWFVGDSTADVEAAHRSGLRSILVRTGAAGRDRKFPRRPDFECMDIAEAASLVLDVWPRLERQAEELARNVSSGACMVIGGLARTGKSSLASALSIVLRQKGFRVSIVSLDGWLIDSEQRPEAGSVLERYDVEAIRRFAGDISNADLVVDVPVYDRFLRSRAGTYRLEIASDDVLIVEGVVALALDIRWRKSTRRVFVNRAEHARKDAIWRDYTDRGYLDSDIKAIYQRRQLDENDVILQSLGTADDLVESSFE